MIRRIVRSISFRADRLRRYTKAFGALRGARIFRALWLGSGMAKLRVPGIPHPIWVRARSSDAIVFEQVFVSREYDFPLRGEPKLVIDAGANIGLAAVWFATRYPHAEVVCVEPESSNYELLVRNAASYGRRIQTVQAGLWRRKTFLRITNLAEGAKWAFRVEECDDPMQTDIPAVTIDDLVAMTTHQRIDLLKIDIEGSEKEVFTPGCESWLARTSVLAAETHDTLVPGCSAAIENQVARFPHRRISSGENVVYLFE